MLLTVKPALIEMLLALGVALALGVGIGMMSMQSRQLQPSGAAAILAAPEEVIR